MGQINELSEINCKKEVMEQANKEGNIVDFAALIDLCHLKNSEFEKFQKLQRP